MPKFATLISVLALVALLVPAGAASAKSRGGDRCTGADSVPTKRTLHRAARATLCLVNVERRKRDRRSLRSHRELRRPAERYSRNMTRMNFFGHETPGGRDLLDRVRRYDYLDGMRRYRLGENIAWGSGRMGTPRQIVKAWMKSTKHRRNILDKRFRHSGIGLAWGAPEEGASGAAVTYTHVFGRRSRR